MQSSTIRHLAAFAGATAVLLGAFAAHALRGRLDEAGLAVFETAVQYHMYHALALGLCAMRTQLRLAPWCFLIGILLFSGSLYLMAFTGLTFLGMVTPLGGLSMMAGWAVLALAALKLEKA